MTTFIGRLQHIGLGKESVPGTAVAAAVWIPHDGQGGLKPKYDTAKDDAAYGSIFGLRDQQTVKEWTEIMINAVARTKFLGHFLQAAFGTSTPCVAIPIPGAVTGTFVLGETVTETTSAATGLVKRIDVAGSSKVIYLSVVSGTFAGAKLLTGGTSGATATGGTIQAPGTVRSHVFTLANNNTHNSYTIYGSDPQGDFRSLWAMLESLELEATANGYLKLTAKFIGKKKVSTTTQTPSYTEEPGFLGKFITFKHATDTTGLDAASATKVERFKLTIKKNPVDYQAMGSVDLEGIYNQRFDVSGELDLKYDDTTWEGYVSASTKRAMRLTAANTDVTIGTTNPTLMIDLPQVSFDEWDRDNNKDQIVRQSLKFSAELDDTRGAGIECILTNDQITAY